jgi:hypothetical protein
MAVTGHRTSKELTRYTRAARQRVLPKMLSLCIYQPMCPTMLSKSKWDTQTDDLDAENAPELRGMVPRGGIEPPTLRFSVACSTN